MVNNTRFSQATLFEIGRQARLELIRRAAAKKDILGWGELLFPGKFPLSFCQELHGYFVEIRGKEFTCTEAPRNHAKTTIKCFLIPLFQALNEPETFRHYLNVQATHGKAMAVNLTIRNELNNNEDLRAIYGDQVGDRWSENQFVLKNGVCFTAIGAGQSIRGLNYLSIRPDYIIVDDLYDEDDINNPDATLKKNAWFWGSLYPARANSSKCSVHIQGTAINGQDILEVLKKLPSVHYKTFKSYDPNTEVPMWPELNSFADLMDDKEKMGSIIFNREMQNERRDDADSIIKRAWLNAWEYDPADLSRALAKEEDRDVELVEVLVGNDPSIGKNSDSDCTGTALVLKTRKPGAEGNDYWIEGLWNERLSLEARKNQLLSIRNGRPEGKELSQVIIEAIAGFDDYATYIISQTNLPVKRISFVKDKISTLESKSHYFENGKVHLNRNIEQKLKDKIMEQLTTNYPKHDDLRDAVLLCFEEKSGADIILL